MYTLLLSGMDDKKRGPQQFLKTVEGPKQIIQLNMSAPALLHSGQPKEVTHKVYHLWTTQHMVPVIKEMVVYVV